jgi:predicted transposase/invertase (TIGR01784 family)
MKKEQYGRYMNLMTDFAFKKVFGTEENKALLIAFLNEVVPHKETIVDVQYLPTEQLGNIKDDRKAIFDLYCIDEKGERYIIEMQVVQQEHFMGRSLFYATFPIQSQATKGKWNFELKPLYHIAILNFSLFDDDDCISHVSLVKEETKKKVSDILNFIIVELPKFRKEIKELKTKLDCWLFSFKNLHKLEVQPPEIQGEIFDKLFSVADTNKLTTMEQRTYKRSVTQDYDVQLAMDYSRKKGIAKGEEIGIKKGEQRGLQRGLQQGMQQGLQQGMQQGLIAVAKAGLKEGLSVELVAKLTGLTIQQVKSLALFL